MKYLLILGSVIALPSFAAGGGDLDISDGVGVSFWLVTAAMLAATVFFFVERDQVSAKWKTSLTVSGNITGQSYISATTAIQTTPVVVGSLPAAATAGAGARAFVSDANDTAFNAIVAGAGANNLPVFSDGTNWRIG